MNDQIPAALRLQQLEEENAKLRKINLALMNRVDKGLADNGNSFTLFQLSVELEQRILERTQALEKAMADLEATNFALTEAKRAAELAQGRLDVAVETIADGFALWSPDDTLVRFNAVFTGMFPALRALIQPGMRFTDFLHAAIDAQLVLDAADAPGDWFDRRIAYHQSPHDSLIIAMADGTWQRVSERLTGDGGRVAIYTDITDIKLQEMRRRERELAAQSELLQLTMNTIRQGIAVFDDAGRLMTWNQRFAELNDLPGALLQAGMAIDTPFFALSCPVSGTAETVSPSGRTLEIQHNPMPHGGFVMTYADISDRKQAEQALREGEAKMRLITDALPALIAYVDNQQIYRFTNKGYEDWFGIPRSQINGRSMRDVLGPEMFDVREHYVRQALEGHASSFELAVPAPRRNIEFARATFIPHFGDQGEVLGFFALIQDVSDSRKAAQALEQAKGQLEVRVAERTGELRETNLRLQEAIRAAEEAQRSKTRFFAAASHDLLQPLNSARLFLAALSGQTLPPATTRLVDNTGASLEAVDDLINTLLEISRLDAGAVETEFSHFDLAGLIDQLATEFAPLADAAGLGLRRHALPVVVHSDAVLLGRVLRNFLSNALRYTRQGGILLGCRRTTEGVLIGVWDQGAGIPADKLPSVFNEFQRLPEHAGMCSKGMGLGLAIVQRLARRMGHRLVVKSQFGRGSLFGIVVPYGDLALVGPPPVPEDAVSAAVSGNPSGALVLLIDNDATILEGMETLLNDWQYDTLAAASAAEAIALLDQHGCVPDAILADYHLDDGALGSDAIRAVRAHLGQAVPAALVTADRTTEVQQEAESEGWAWLAKPVRPARLRALLSNLTR